MPCFCCESISMPDISPENVKQGNSDIDSELSKNSYGINLVVTTDQNVLIILAKYTFQKEG